MCMLPNKGLRILHVSDLHIDSVEDRAWKMVCHDLVDREKPDLCVISGDLPRHSPSMRLYKALRVHLDKLFPDRKEVDHSVGCPWRWIVVPGNHDRRLLGNFLSSENLFEEGLGVDEAHGRHWKKPWWDPQYPCIVVPLDSNPHRWDFLPFGASLARGALGDECGRIEQELSGVQESVMKHYLDVLDRMPPRDAARCGMNLWAAFAPEIVQRFRRIAYPPAGDPPADSLSLEVLAQIARVLSCLYMARVVRCVVFHHHPIGVPDVDRSDITHRENYLLLIDSGEFLQSARKNKICLVLHGHKHIPHRIGVTLPGQDTEVIGIVGAGCSTHGSRHRAASANMIEINSQGEVGVTLCELPGDDSIGSKPRLQLRTWSQVRTHLAGQAQECSKISSEYSNHEISVLPWGDAIVTRHMRGLGPGLNHTWKAVHTIEIPINFECFTQIGRVQVACQIEKHEYEWEQIRCRTHREPGYSAGEWRGFAEIRLPRDARKRTLAITMRLAAFSAFPMNPWQASFIPTEVLPSGNDDCYTWRSRIPVRKQLSVALESVGDKTAAIFDGPAAMYSRIDGEEDIGEYEQIVVDRTASGHRIAFTVPSPIWGSEYGISWTWRRRSFPTHQKAPGSSRLRDALETEAKNMRADRSSPLQSAIRQVLREGSGGFEAAVYVLTRRRKLEPGKLIRIAMANDAQIPSGQLPEMNFGAGVAGRAASLQETIAWAPCGPHARLEETLADFYIAPPEGHGHTAIVAIPIPRRQPLAILSIASRKDNDSLSSTIREILKQSVPQRDQACKRLAWIPRLAGEIHAVFKRTQFDPRSEPAVASDGGPSGSSEPDAARLSCPVAVLPNLAVENWWDEAIQPVDPDRIQQRLRQYVVNLDDRSP